MSISIPLFRVRAGRVACALLTVTLFAIDATGQTEEKQPYSPYVGRDFPANVYFGDTHLQHTAVSRRLR